MADAHAKENAKLKSDLANGDSADLGWLKVKQLQTLAKQNGVAIACTKADFIKLPDLAARSGCSIWLLDLVARSGCST